MEDVRYDDRSLVLTSDRQQDKMEVRPQIGYSMILPSSNQSDMDSLNTIKSGVAYSIGTGLRLNFGKRTCYMLNVEYLSAKT
jgi:hypothetical protein